MNSILVKPSVGRIVHYFDALQGTGPYAAIITKVPIADDDTVILTVFRPDYIHVDVVAKFSDKSLGGHWMWPPKV